MQMMRKQELGNHAWMCCAVCVVYITLCVHHSVCVHAKSWLAQFDFANWSLNLRHVRHVVVPENSKKKHACVAIVVPRAALPVRLSHPIQLRELPNSSRSLFCDIA